MAIEAGHGEQAEAALRQTLQQTPDKHAIRALLVEYLLGQGQLDEAQSVLAEVTDDAEPLRPFRARFALLEKLEGTGQSLAELSARLAENAEPEDLYCLWFAGGRGRPVPAGAGGVVAVAARPSRL